MHGGRKRSFWYVMALLDPVPRSCGWEAKTIKNRKRLCDDAVQEAPAGQGKANAVAFWRDSLK